MTAPMNSDSTSDQNIANSDMPPAHTMRPRMIRLRITDISSDVVDLRMPCSIDDAMSMAPMHGTTSM